jgi:hypothetical protein
MPILGRCKGIRTRRPARSVRRKSRPPRGSAGSAEAVFDGEQTTLVGAPPPPPTARRRWPRLAAALGGLLVLGLAGSSCDAVEEDNQPPPQETSDSSAAGSAAGDQAGIERGLERQMRRQLEGEIARDARKHDRERVPGGPIKRARCTLSNREPGGRGRYKCLAITSEGGDRAEGYEYQGTVNGKNGEMRWERSDSP